MMQVVHHFRSSCVADCAECVSRREPMPTQRLFQIIKDAIYARKPITQVLKWNKNGHVSERHLQGHQNDQEVLSY